MKLERVKSDDALRRMWISARDDLRGAETVITNLTSEVAFYKLLNTAAIVALILIPVIGVIIAIVGQPCQ